MVVRKADQRMERTAEVERLTEHGCSVLCLGCPEGMLFGIDYSAWTVGPRFMGVKLVPPGLHYIYSSGSGEDVGVGRTGFFLLMEAKQVMVFRWDPLNEELTMLDDKDEESRYVDGVRGFDFDSNLGPYPLDLSAQWVELTRHASPRLVRKIEPLGKAIRHKRAEYDAGASQQNSNSTSTQSKSEEVSISDNADDPMIGQSAQTEAEPVTQSTAQSGLESNDGSGTLFFSTIPRSRKAKHNSPAETTQIHMDRTKQLEEMIRSEYETHEMSILGELQLAYITFILGQNYDGFEQWRALLLLLCSCEGAVITRPELFAELCRVFFAQLSQAPADLFGDDLTKENFMGSSVLSLIELCDADGLPLKLRRRCGKLRELVQEKFGISVEDLALLGVDAPQIVESDGRDLINLEFSSFAELD